MNYLIISKFAQVIFAVLIVALVLIQTKSMGLSSGIKSSFNMYRSLRGVERLVFVLTIVLTFLFVANSIALVLLSK